jgi:microcystin-dependent protein
MTAPIGTVTTWPTGRRVPAGWLLCDGGTFHNVEYPILAATLGSTTLPDMRPGVGDPDVQGIIKASYDTTPAELNSRLATEDPYETGYREGAASAMEDMETIKAEALREAAVDLERDATHMAATWWFTGWLRKRAEQIEDGTL